MRKDIIIILVLLLPTLALAQNTGEDLVAASIKFHDPDNQWMKVKAEVSFSDSRPGEDDRSAKLYINNSNSTLCVMREQDGAKITRHTENNLCTYDVDGNLEPSAEEIEKYTLTEERSLMLRNYYLFLWGLPMKLNDPGTIIDPTIYEKDFDGRKTKAVRVTYDEEVGSDIWYFYFDPTTSEMIGYQFFHDEAINDGEYILISGIEVINGMKIPKNRAWYTNADSTLLGTDHLIGTTALVHSH